MGQICVMNKASKGEIKKFVGIVKEAKGNSVMPKELDERNSK